MADFRFALDEDVSHRFASLLRSRGWNVDSAKELDRLGLSDVQVLLRAAADGQTLVTHNIKDFRALHEAWVTWRWRWAAEVEHVTGRPVHLSQHAGILITPHLPNHELARILEEFADAAEPMADRLFSWTQVGGWHEVRFEQ
ncbi:MAG: DUF5615 family PIN-like protein [Thermomicrobiales bacterium]